MNKTIKNKPLEKTVEKTEEEIKNIAESLLGKDKPPLEVVLSDTHKTVEGIETKEGIIIPSKVFVGKTKTNWTYIVSVSSEVAIVERESLSGYIEEVRTYTKEIHGERFAELAHQLAQKKTK